MYFDPELIVLLLLFLFLLLLHLIEPAAVVGLLLLSSNIIKSLMLIAIGQQFHKVDFKYYGHYS
jgi:hypothetical protein